MSVILFLDCMSKSTNTLFQIMALYEILFGAEAYTSKQAASWLSHAEGEIALIVARGPEAFTEDSAHSVFVNARYRPIIASARMRVRTVLNEEKWKTIPWRGRIKTPYDTLLDIMAGVPEIMENVDRFGALSLGTPQDEARDLETSAKCWTVHIQLQNWLLVNEHEIYTPLTTSATPITFPNLEVACMTIKYWVTCLLTYSCLDTASRIPITDSECTHPDRPHPRQFARLIARSASYFFREDFGINGPTTLTFPLGNALLYFRRDPVLDSEYLILIKQAWSDPKLSTAIRSFLDSLRVSVTAPQGGDRG
jgi:hypothetical protein